MRNKRVILVIILMIVIALLAVIGTYGAIFFDELYGDKQTQGENIEITIPQGSTNKKIAQILQDNKVIKSKQAFLMRVKRLGYSDKLKYGTFEINTGMNKDELIKTLSKKGKYNNVIEITIPEGYSIQQIAGLLEEKNICTKEEFLEASNKEYEYEFLEDVPENVDYKVQGFLFPSTYEIYKDASAEDVIKVLLDEFDKRFIDKYKEELEETDKSIYEIITMASMIEREAKLDDERKTIAGVLYNRLKIDMKLQIDATAQYAITEGMYNVTRIYNKDLNVNSKYNTYKYKGLPVGPICNPGVKSIEAALMPEKHEYLYYHVVDASTGKHGFFKTYEEHIQ